MSKQAECTFDVFISYSHTDQEWVKNWLLPRLEAAGLRVCIDYRDFDVGVPSLVNIERAVDNSRRTLLVLTPAWVESAWAEFESLLTQTADPAARQRRLLPLVLQTCQPPRRIEMSSTGGTVDVTWQVASVTVPMSRVELVVNGEIRESLAVPPDQACGNWSVKVEKSSWLALLVRGHYADKPEIIAAHSSPVMVTVAGSPMLAAADAVTILEQIEGALAYLDTVGTRAENAAYKRMRLQSHACDEPRRILVTL